MLDNVFARASVAKFIDPIARWLVGKGVSPNAVTIIGTLGGCAAALWFIPRGQLFVGAALVTIFVLLDLLDGAIARIRGGGTPFGAVLDATCDRIVDGVLFAAITWWALSNGQRPLAIATLICLVGAQVISYVKARADASGLSAAGGVAERSERFLFTLIGVGLHGLGVPFVLPIALWVLAALVVLTVVQRLVAVRDSARKARE